MAKVRHLVVLNDLRISENLDLININEDDIENLEVSISENLDQINDLQTSMGNVESFPPPGRIIFSAYKATCCQFSGDVTYTNLVENVGNGLDIRNGVFRCPQTGLYMLSFSGKTYHGENWTNVQIYINGEEYFKIQSSTSEHHDHISHTWLSHLKVNDKVNLKITHGEMYTTRGYYLKQAF